MKPPGHMEIGYIPVVIYYSTVCPIVVAKYLISREGIDWDEFRDWYKTN